MIDNKLYLLYDCTVLTDGMVVFDFGDHRELHSNLATKVVRLTGNDEAFVMGNNRVFVAKAHNISHGFHAYYLMDDYLNIEAEGRVRPEKLYDNLYEFDILYDADFKKVPWLKYKHICLCSALGQGLVYFAEEVINDIEVYDTEGNRYNNRVIGLIVRTGENTPFSIVDLDGTKLLKARTANNKQSLVYAGKVLTAEGRANLQHKCMRYFGNTDLYDINFEEQFNTLKMQL